MSNFAVTRVLRVVLRSVPLLLALDGMAFGQSPTGAPTPIDDPEAAVAALNKPSVAGEVDTPAIVRVGRAEIRPAPGARVFLLDARGRRCGVLIDGDAAFTYLVDDAFSAPLARRNGPRAHGVSLRDTGAQVVFTSTLRGAAIWGWDLDVGSVQPRQSTATLPEWVASILEHKLSSNPGRDMFLALANDSPGYRWAVLHTSDDDLLLDVDPRVGVQAEALQRLWKLNASNSAYPGMLAAEDLVSQPIGRHWWDGLSPDIVASDTEVKVVNDKGSHAVVTTHSRIDALRGPIRVLSLSLVPFVLTERDERRPLTISRLAVDGAPARSVRDNSDLLVELPHTLNKGDAASLDVTVEGDLLQLPEGDNYWVLRTLPWYPRPARPGLEWASFRLSVTTPPPFVPFAAGKVTQAPSPSNGNTVMSQLDGPMGYATVFAGKYTTVTDERDGARVSVSTYAGARPGEAHRVAGVVHAVRGCMEHLLGVPYPFRDLQVVEINEWGWGQAPPGVIFITKEALLSNASSAMLDDGDQPTAARVSRGVNERLAHEVAHGWFPHVAKITGGGENWLSESFAEYMSAVCIEDAAADVKRGKYLFDRQLSGWRTGTSELNDKDSIYLAANLGGGREADGREWRDLLYAKGPLVLHALRQELARTAGGDKEGDRLFFTWLRSYVKNFTYKMGGTRYLVAILNQVTGKDWQPWFEQYVYGTATPKLN